jgi:hypothetical protein
MRGLLGKRGKEVKMLKNERVRVEMAKAGINQSKLSKILDKDPPTITRLLNDVEWSRREQDDVIKKIREYAASVNA